ncbi:hypothetical protein MBRA1_002580 [Malassezia brasiliensis]|uniref:Uncharacterized protein n=1 Tax=Malassezia brasiliensis TaxID=1821822 RepID=A0AAF0IQB4_9BASI|nr:hypothetical protein MBRA1_002580 [Malassezia brasiliensis]
MDPLLQPLLRLSTSSKPEEVSNEDAKAQIDAFMAEYKHRCGADPTGNPDGADVANSGGVLLSQLINLRNGLDSA